MRDFGYRADGGVWLFTTGSPLTDSAGIALPLTALRDHTRERMRVPIGADGIVPRITGLSVDLHRAWQVRLWWEEDYDEDTELLTDLDGGVSEAWLTAVGAQQCLLLWAYDDVFAAERYFEAGSAVRFVEPGLLEGSAIGVAQMTPRSWFDQAEWRHPLFPADPPPWRTARRVRDGTWLGG